MKKKKNNLRQLLSNGREKIWKKMFNGRKKKIKQINKTVGKSRAHVHSTDQVNVLPLIIF